MNNRTNKDTNKRTSSYLERTAHFHIEALLCPGYVGHESAQEVLGGRREEVEGIYSCLAQHHLVREGVLGPLDGEQTVI